MRKWLTPIAAAALSAAVVAPTLAGAASGKKCSLDLSFLTAPVKVSGTPPIWLTSEEVVLMASSAVNWRLIPEP